MLHSFVETAGAEPQAGLPVAGERLYGTTSSGGGIGVGTAFSITRAGKLTLFPFTLAEGATPNAGFTLFKGVLFGTAANGGDIGGACGKFGRGTVFSVAP